MAKSNFRKAASNAKRSFDKAGKKAGSIGRVARANMKAKAQPSAEQRNRNAFRGAGRRAMGKPQAQSAQPQMAEKIAGGMNSWKNRRQDAIDQAGR